MVDVVLVIEIISFFDLLAVGIIVPLIQSHVMNLGGEPIVIGLLGSVYAIFQLISGPLVGSLSDLKGRKIILIGSLIMSGISYMFIGFSSNILTILTIRAFLGFFKQTQMLTKALITDHVPKENQAEIFGKMASLSGLGITLGPFIGGHVMENYPDDGFRYCSFTSGGLFIWNAVLANLLPNIAKKEESQKRGGRCHTPTEPKSLWHNIFSSLTMSITQLSSVKWSLYGDIFLYKSLLAFSMAIYFSQYTTYLRIIYSLSPKYIGYVISFQGLVGCVTCYLMGSISRLYVNDTDFSLRNFHVFLTLTLTQVGMIVSPNAFLFAIFLGPLSAANSLGRLITLEMIVKRSEEEHRGKLLGAASSVRSLAAIVAPIISGAIVQYINVSYVFYVSFLTSFVGLAISYTSKFIMKTNGHETKCKKH